MKNTFDIIIAKGANLSTTFCSAECEQLSIPCFFDEEVKSDGNETND